MLHFIKKCLDLIQSFGNFEEFEFIKNTRDAIQIMDKSNYNKDLTLTTLKKLSITHQKCFSEYKFKAGVVLKT